MSIVYGDDKLVRGSEVIELYVDAGWSLLAGRPSAEIEESVRHSAAFVTARDGARLVGFVSLLSDRSHYAHITEFIVRRSYQAREVGAELLKRALEAVPRERVVSILAEPDSDSFYRRFGFAPTAGAMILRRS